MTETYDKIDEAMLPLGELIELCCSQQDELTNEVCSMRFTGVEVGFPLQLDLQVGENGQVVLGGSPPLYYTETSVLPVFHQLSLWIEPHESSDNNKSDES